MRTSTAALILFLGVLALLWVADYSLKHYQPVDMLRTGQNR